MRARNSKYQVDQHAPVERQFLNRNWFHHLTHRSIGGVQHWSLVSHLHYVLHGGNLECQIQREFLANLQTQTPVQRGEVGRLHFEGIVAWH